MNGPVRRNREAQSGAAVVEFACVIPIFLLLVVGTIEIGRALMVQELITNASREGARIAGYDTTTDTSTVTSAVSSYLSNAGISGPSTVVNPDPPSNAADGQAVTVTVSIPYAKVSWVPSPFFLGGTTLSAVSVMRRQPAP